MVRKRRDERAALDEEKPFASSSLSSIQTPFVALSSTSTQQHSPRQLIPSHAGSHLAQDSSDHLPISLPSPAAMSAPQGQVSLEDLSIDQLTSVKQQLEEVRSTLRPRPAPF